MFRSVCTVHNRPVDPVPELHSLCACVCVDTFSRLPRLDYLTHTDRRRRLLHNNSTILGFMASCSVQATDGTDRYAQKVEKQRGLDQHKHTHNSNKDFLSLRFECRFGFSVCPVGSCPSCWLRPPPRPGININPFVSRSLKRRWQRAVVVGSDT